MAKQRPILRYHGGKWILAPWIISHFPAHRIYVEPYCGAASVLFRKEPCFSEIINDQDDQVVNLFRILRDPISAQKLITAIELSPYSETEFKQSYEISECPIESARRLLCRSFMGFSALATSGGNTGFRADSNRSGSVPAHDWKNFPSSLPFAVDRLKACTVLNKSALTVMEHFDRSDALHYVDPPYLNETRSMKQKDGQRHHQYRHEMSDVDHDDLLELLRSLKGMVILSGYPNQKYNHALDDWQRVERKALADGAQQRIEVLWKNPAAVHAMGHGALFDAAA